jgi:hypothetical protein
MNDFKHNAVLVGLCAAICFGLIILIFESLSYVVSKETFAISVGMLITFIIFYSAAKN